MKIKRKYNAKILYFDFSFCFGKFGVLFTEYEKKFSKVDHNISKKELEVLWTQIPLPLLTKRKTKSA